MTIIKSFCLSTLLVTLMAGLTQAQTTPQVFSDSFSDGKLDKTLWTRPQWSTVICQENGGHLRMFSNPTNGELFQMAGVISTFTRKYNGGDTLSIYGTVRVPHKIPSQPGAIVSNAYEIGIGLFQSPTNFNYVELLVRDSLSNRQFGVYYYTEEGGYVFNDYWSYGAPTNISVFKLRMTYSCATDKIGFFWAPEGSTSWTKICPPLTMADLFGPASPKRMIPYITGYTENCQVPRDWNVWIDDFKAVYRDRPL